MMNRHDIHFVKRARAGRTFAHSVADTIVDALVTKEMAAGLERCILKVIAANCAQSKSLKSHG